MARVLYDRWIIEAWVDDDHDGFYAEEGPLVDQSEKLEDAIRAVADSCTTGDIKFEVRGDG